MSEFKRSAEEMNTAFTLVGLALGVGFAFFVPVFFTSIAEWNASLGDHELKRFLPKIFKIGFWISAAASVANFGALPFLEEERAEIAICIVTGGTLAWRLWSASKKAPIHLPETTRGK